MGRSQVPVLRSPKIRLLHGAKLRDLTSKEGPCSARAGKICLSLGTMSAPTNSRTNLQRSPSLGVPVLHAYPEIGNWCLAPSVAIAFGRRLGGTLHLAGP